MTFGSNFRTSLVRISVTTKATVLVNYTATKVIRLYGFLVFYSCRNAFFQMLEARLVLRVREKDVGVLEEVLAPASEYYQRLTGRRVRMQVDKKTFLPPSSLGGVILLTPDGKIYLTNTFQFRVDIVMTNLAPVIGRFLFLNIQ